MADCLPPEHCPLPRPERRDSERRSPTKGSAQPPRQRSGLRNDFAYRTPCYGVGAAPPPPPAGTSSSPLASTAFRRRPTTPPALEGAIVTVMTVPGISDSIERFLLHPFLISWAGFGSSSAPQFVTLPFSSVTSKKSWGCGLTYRNSVTTALEVHILDRS